MHGDVCGGLLKDSEADLNSARTFVTPNAGDPCTGRVLARATNGSRAQRKSGSDSDSSDDLGLIEAVCPICFRLIDFLEGWCTRVRCAALCWAVAIGFLIWLWAILRNLVWGTQGDSSYSAQLVGLLYDLRNESFRFGTVCQFKQWTGMNSLPTPDFFGAVHHEGVFLEIIDADGMQQSFLQVDYGHAGTRFGLNKRAYPMRLYGIREYDWTPGCPYHCGVVSPSDGDPARFVEFLEQYKSWHYNVFWYNCFSFAQLVFNWHNPQTPYSCYTPTMSNAAVKTLLSTPVTAEPPVTSEPPALDT